jgi:hypothetical protein
MQLVSETGLVGNLGRFIKESVVAFPHLLKFVYN